MDSMLGNRRWSRITAFGPVISAVAVVGVTCLAFWQVRAQTTAVTSDVTSVTANLTSSLTVARCGDGTCQTESGEEWTNCPADCPLTMADTCGDGRCDSGTGETATTCPGDCSSSTTVSCGDGRCDAAETAATCPGDCLTEQPAISCGDATCDFDAGETPASCPIDCGGTETVTFICGDGRCDSSRGESFSNCQADCLSAARCGDGLCDVGVGETAISCSEDCGPVAFRCGDGFCQTGSGESETSCPVDCHPVTSSSVCGDGRCETGETPSTCPLDCPTSTPVQAEPTCGDGRCETGETASGCPKDCAATTTQVKPACGDGICETDESASSCPSDCVVKTETSTFVCGDGRCDNGRGEGADNWARDCGGPATSAVATACTDSDGGRDIAVRGSVKKGTSSYVDACVTANHVREYACEGGRVTESVLTCPVGSACRDGRCSKTTSSACGDGRCDSGETAVSCPEDCTPPPASRTAIDTAAGPVLHVDCVSAGLKTRDECDIFLRERLVSPQGDTDEPTLAASGLSPLCTAQGIISLDRCEEFLKSNAQPVTVFLETSGKFSSAIGDGQERAMSPECFRLAAKDEADCARIISGEGTSSGGTVGRSSVNGDLPVSCRERGLAGASCVSFLKKDAVPAACHEAGIDTVEKCLAWLAARRLPAHCAASPDDGCAGEAADVLPALCRNLGVTDLARCRDAFFSAYGLPGRCADMDMDACWRLVTSGELGDASFDAKVQSREVSDDCRALGAKTMDECQKLKAAKSLSEECLAAGHLTPEACSRYLFDKSPDVAATTVLPAACNEAGISDSSECTRRLAQPNLPVECAKAGLGNPDACRRFLELTKLPEACRIAGIGGREECEKHLRERAVVRYCANGDVAGDAAACQEAIFREVGARVRCEGLSAAECQAVVKTSGLGGVAEAERMVRAVENARVLSDGKPVKLADLNVVSGAAAAEVGKMMLFAAGSDADATLLPSRASIVMDASGDVRPVLPTVVVIDRDRDGVPDDMEAGLGLDPLKAETQPGVADGEAFRARAIQSGAPIERAVAADQPLGQPLNEGDVDGRLAVRSVSFAPTEAGAGTPVSAVTVPTLNLSGNGVSGETVTVYIYSGIPLVMTTEVGKDGEWRLNIDEPLVDGVHEVYVAVNDDTGRVVRKSERLSFVISAARAMTPNEAFASDLPIEVSAEANAASGSAAEGYLRLYVIGGVSLLFVAMAVLAAVLLGRRKED